MLPSFCEGVPSDMSPSEWCFGVTSGVASGIITRKWRTGFKWIEGSAGHFLENRVQMDRRNCWAFSEERGSNGERETQGVFWRMGFTTVIASYRQATGVQLENGVHDLANESNMKLSGFKCGDPGSSA